MVNNVKDRNTREEYLVALLINHGEAARTDEEN